MAKAYASSFVARLKQRLAVDRSASVILRAASGNFTVAVLGTGLAFIMNLLLARWMGAAQFGAYAYALTWMTALSILTTLGRTSVLVRFLPGYLARREYGLLRGLLQESSLHVTVASIAVAVLVVACVVVLRARMEPAVYEALLLGACGLLPVLGLLALRRESLRGLHHSVRSAVPEGIVRPVGTLAFVLPFLLLGQGALTAAQAMAASIASALLALGASTLWLRERLPREARREPPIHVTRQWMSVSVPLLANLFLTYALGAADMLMLGLFAPAEVVGTYAVASRLAALALFGVAAVGNILAPMIAEQHALNDPARMQRVVRQAARLAAAVTALEIVGLAILAPSLLGLFGPAFAVAYVPMLLLLAGHAINALSGNAGFLMTMTGHHVQTLGILGFALLVNVGLNLLLIPRWGAEGAAVATAVSEALWTLHMAVYVRRRMGINTTIFERSGRLRLAEEKSE